MTKPYTQAHVVTAGANDEFDIAEMLGQALGEEEPNRTLVPDYTVRRTLVEPYARHTLQVHRSAGALIRTVHDYAGAAVWMPYGHERPDALVDLKTPGELLGEFADGYAGYERARFELRRRVTGDFADYYHLVVFGRRGTGDNPGLESVLLNDHASELAGTHLYADPSSETLRTTLALHGFREAGRPKHLSASLTLHPMLRRAAPA